MLELTQFERKVTRISSGDNVAVALTNLRAGDSIVLNGKLIALRTDIPIKHKVALYDFVAGDEIVMYGVAVGEATTLIREGEVLTTGNTRHQSVTFGEKNRALSWEAPNVERWEPRTFQGYHRRDGQVGTRNYWLVIPLVFCENRNILALREAFEKELGIAAPQTYRRFVGDLSRLYRAGNVEEIKRYEFSGSSDEAQSEAIFPNLDGVRFLTHDMGCGGTRQDARSLCGLLAGYVHHPNVAGATVLSLGCQNAEVSLLKEELLKRDPQSTKPVLIFDQQESRLESKMISEAIRETFLGLIEANRCNRQPAPLAKLTVGLKCGGSDGFSGITANPAIGRVSDLIAALGGKSILSEFPELCGMEQNIVDRCIDHRLANKFTTLFRTYAEKAHAADSGFEKNPSPGNIRDGLLTDAMKSAGAARKGGTSPVRDVLDYPEYATTAGLNLLCTPGNDVEAVTAQVGAGANVVLFTTGLGTPTGNPIAPVVKIATNSDLARRMHDIIDIDTGEMISSMTTVEEMGHLILEDTIAIASGATRTKAEKRMQEDFIPWKRGVSL